MSHPLAHLVPTVPAGTVSRIDAQSGKSYDDILLAARRMQKNVLLSGPAGCGKTTMVRDFCARHGIPLYVLNGGDGIDADVVLGGLRLGADGIWRTVDGAAPLMTEHGGCLYLTEIGSFPTDVSMSFNPLMDAQRTLLMHEQMRQIPAHPDLLIVADWNPGYRGVRPLNAAVADRFGIKLEMTYDPALERKVTGSPELVEAAKILRQRDLSVPVTTRSLVDFVDNYRALGWDFALHAVANAFPLEERSGSADREAGPNTDTVIGAMGLRRNLIEGDLAGNASERTFDEDDEDIESEDMTLQDALAALRRP